MRTCVVQRQGLTLVHSAKGATPQELAQLQATNRGALPLPQQLCQRVQCARLDFFPTAGVCKSTAQRMKDPSKMLGL